MEADPTETAAVEEAIRTGKVNIANVVAAVRSVIENADAVVEWEFDPSTIPILVQAGLTSTITPDSLTIGEQVYVVDTTGVGWDSFDPRNDQRYARAMLVAVVAHRCIEGDDRFKRAEVVVDQVTTGEFDAAYTIAEKRPADPT